MGSLQKGSLCLRGSHCSHLVLLSRSESQVVFRSLFTGHDTTTLTTKADLRDGQ